MFSHFVNCFIIFLIGLFLFLIRIYQLFHSAPFDYDSVKNFQIIQELTQGDFHNFFHHASPVLYVCFLPFYLVYPNFWFLVFINSMLNVLSIFLWVKLADFRQKTYEIGAFLLLGTAFFAVAYSRTLGIETLGLLLGAILGLQIKSFFEQKSLFWNKPLSIGIVGALLLMTNYKAIVPLFFLILGIWLHRKKLQKQLQTIQIIQVALGFFAMIVFFMLVGILMGLRWYQYPATILSIFAVAQDTPAHPFNGRFYFQYLAEYENVILMLLAIWQIRRILKFPEKNHLFWKNLTWLVLLTFLVMFLLPKAPRGLIFILPLLYLLGIEQMKKFFTEKLNKPFLYFVAVSILLIWQIWGIWQKIYPYAETNYPKVAEILQKEQAEVVFTTLGIGIYPFLDKNIKLEILREASDTIKFQQYKGKKFLLYDSYGEISLHKSLTSLKNWQYDHYFEEKSLCNPFLSLENIQYTGLKWQNAVKLSEKLSKRKWQIALKQISD